MENMNTDSTVTNVKELSIFYYTIMVLAYVFKKSSQVLEKQSEIFTDHITTKICFQITGVGVKVWVKKSGHELMVS